MSEIADGEGDDINTPRGLRCFDDAYGHNVMS